MERHLGLGGCPDQLGFGSWTPQELKTNNLPPMEHAMILYTDGTAEYVADLNCFRLTSRALKSSIMRSAEILLSDGSVHPISAFSNIRRVNPPWKFEFFNAVCDVTIELGNSNRKISLDLTKKLIRKSKSLLQLSSHELHHIESKNSIQEILNTLYVYERAEE